MNLEPIEDEYMDAEDMAMAAPDALNTWELSDDQLRENAEEFDAWTQRQLEKWIQKRAELEREQAKKAKEEEKAKNNTLL